MKITKNILLLVIISMTFFISIQRMEKGFKKRYFDWIRYVTPYLYARHNGWAIGMLEDIQLALWAKDKIGNSDNVVNLGGFFSQWFILSGMKCVFTRAAIHNHKNDREIKNILEDINNGNYIETQNLLAYGVKYLFVSARLYYVPINPYLKLIKNYKNAQLFEVMDKFQFDKEGEVAVCNVQCMKEIYSKLGAVDDGIYSRKVDNTKFEQICLRKRSNFTSTNFWEYVSMYDAVFIPSKKLIKIPFENIIFN